MLLLHNALIYDYNIYLLLTFIMKRKNFVKHVLLGSVTMVGLPLLAKGHKSNYDTLRKDISENDHSLKSENRVGYNHIPNNEIQKMNSIIHRADTRGSADHGWLKVNHTFSFANYHNPERMNFGVLRVLNDDSIAGGKGFPSHPHDNMEIITIPLEGDLEHKDSMGNSSVIRNGDVQVMSAGTGIYHSEFNHNSNDAVKVLQIWLFPNKRNVSPRYDQLSIDKINGGPFKQILSPSPDDDGVWIHQNAWFHIGSLQSGHSSSYTMKKKGNGAYLFVIEGKIEVNGEVLGKRDGMGVWDVEDISIQSNDSSKVLIMDVPMNIS